MKNWGKFIIETGVSSNDVSVKIEFGDDGNIWLSKIEIAQVYGVFYAAVSSNLRVMFKCGELDERIHMKTIRYINNQGKECQNELFNLEAIISLGFRMKGAKCKLFRRWVANKLSSPKGQNQIAYLFHLCDKGIHN